jgi:MFS family permease
LNRNLWIIGAALFLWGFGEGMFINFVPIYLDRQFLLSEYRIGLILGAFGFSMAITHIPAGRLADRLGRKPLLIIAWILGLISTVVMALSSDLPWFLVGLFGYGLTAFVSSPLNSYVVAASGKLSTGAILALASGTFGLGMVLGPFTGGWIGDQYEMRMSFYVAAFVFAISNLFMYFIEAQPIDRHDPQAPPQGLLQNWQFITFMGVLTFAIFSMYFAQPFTPNFLEKIRELSLSQTGFIFTIGALGNSVMAFSFSRLDPRKGFLWAQVFVVLFALFLWKGTTLPVFALGYFLLGGFRAGKPMAMAQVRDLVHESQMGFSFGIMETITAVIFIVTPPIAGYLFEIDPFIAYPVSIGLITLSILVTYVFKPRKELIHA